MQKYHVITYGCQMNKSDSEKIATVLENIGYQPAPNKNEADLILVNMCSVRQSAVDRIYGLIPKFEKLKKENPKLKTILTGCILKEDRKKLKGGFDFILDIKDLPSWPKYLPQTSIILKPSPLFYDSYLDVKPKYSNNFSAFLPISNGCNWSCAYCVIPFTRGKLVCRNYEEILKEAKDVIEKGVKEIWLLGQNVNDYRSRLTQISTKKNAEINFAKLLKMVNNIEGDFWIRFTSPNPKNFSGELIETMAKCQKVTPHLNLPVQSGDYKILKRMNRPYTVEQYKNLVKKIRVAFKKYRKGLEKDVTISTDIIVGFPGETKKQFENTTKLMKEIKFDMAYIAKYSPRPQTTAFKLKDNVFFEEKERRYKILTEVLKKTALGKNKKFVEKEIEVLVEKKKNDFLIGKSRHYRTVKINLTPKTYYLKPKLVGQFIKVKIVDAFPWGLKGIFYLKVDKPS